MRTLAANVVLVFALLAAGCATVPVRRVGELRPDDTVWLKAGGEQVRFVGELSLPEHLGIEESGWTRFWRWVVGTQRADALYRPFGVAVSSSGVVAVSDPGLRAVRRYHPKENRHERLEQGLSAPLGVAFVGELLVVADGQTLVVFDAAGAVVKAPWKVPVFTRPTGLAVDAVRQRLFVVDAGAHCVHAIALTGAEPAQLGARGTRDGQFNYPTHVAVDGRGHLFVTDSMNFRVQEFDEGLAFVRALGGLGDGPGDLPRSKGLAVDAHGTLWVVEGAFDVVQGFDARGELVAVFGGRGTDAGRLWLPAGLAVDASGRLYVADTWNSRVQVFAIEPRPAP
jgi:DNA-binding beta-propeller fold protein YncE